LSSRSAVLVLAGLPIFVHVSAVHADPSSVNVSSTTRQELDGLSAEDRANLGRELIGGQAAPKGSDFLCYRGGCAGGSLSFGESDWRSSPEGTYQDAQGWFAGAQAAAPLARFARYGIGVQVSARYGVYKIAREERSISFTPGTSPELQQLYSVGLFRRPDPFGPPRMRWGAGLAYDISVNNAASEFLNNYVLRQWRAKISYLLTPAHELGLWGAVHSGSPTTDWTQVAFPPTSPFPIRYRSIDQVNLFYKYRLSGGGSLEAYAGPGLRDHLDVPTNPVFPFPTPVPGYHGLLWTAGGRAEFPVNDRWGFFARGSYGYPSGWAAATYAMHVSSMEFGARYFWGANAKERNDSGKRWMPYLEEPDNGNFAAQTNAPY
jgi:hypothetical protein